MRESAQSSMRATPDHMASIARVPRAVSNRTCSAAQMTRRCPPWSSRRANETSAEPIACVLPHLPGQHQALNDQRGHTHPDLAHCSTLRVTPPLAGTARIGVRSPTSRPAIMPAGHPSQTATPTTTPRRNSAHAAERPALSFASPIRTSVPQPIPSPLRAYDRHHSLDIKTTPDPPFSTPHSQTPCDTHKFVRHIGTKVCNAGFGRAARARNLWPPTAACPAGR
jgi:hypothetical protein